MALRAACSRIIQKIAYTDIILRLGYSTLVLTDYIPITNTTQT